MLTDAQLDRTRRLALRLAGIELRDRHREVLARRSRRLGIDSIAGLDNLLSAAEADEPAATRRFVSLITTNFSGFFRHPAQFEVAGRHALRAANTRPARLWSAAAATGEEPYSLALTLIEVFQREDPPATILATDIDTEALAFAENGEYREAALQGLAPEHRARFFPEAEGAPRWRIASAPRRMVEFRPVNLAEPAWSIEGPFDVIFCRNVLMYLESGCRSTVLERLAAQLRPGGLLILDPTEHIGRAGHLFTAEAGGLYSRRVESTAARPGAAVASSER